MTTYKLSEAAKELGINIENLVSAVQKDRLPVYTRKVDGRIEAYFLGEDIENYKRGFYVSDRWTQVGKDIFGKLADNIERHLTQSANTYITLFLDAVTLDEAKLLVKKDAFEEIAKMDMAKMALYAESIKEVKISIRSLLGNTPPKEYRLLEAPALFLPSGLGRLAGILKELQDVGVGPDKLEKEDYKRLQEAGFIPLYVDIILKEGLKIHIPKRGILHTSRLRHIVAEKMGGNFRAFLYNKTITDMEKALRIRMKRKTIELNPNWEYATSGVLKDILYKLTGRVPPEVLEKFPAPEVPRPDEVSEE